MSHALFISDLHLCTSRPHITKIFLSFLANIASQAEALYILGDLFEYWAGDDDIEAPLHAQVVKSFQELRKSNVQMYFMHGNRDFLIAQEFAATAGIALIEDPARIDLYGTDTLLMHGDTLCTDDLSYLKFRAMVRDDRWQEDFLTQPLATRHQLIQAMRARSETEKSTKAVDIMDANESTVLDTFKKFAVPRLIHGHTHRPGCHQYESGGQIYTRWVLPDWYEKGGYLRCDREGCQQLAL